MGNRYTIQTYGGPKVIERVSAPSVPSKPAPVLKGTLSYRHPKVLTGSLKQKPQKVPKSNAPRGW